jgi:membrane fusion protein (multidrug efflux system)
MNPFAFVRRRPITALTITIALAGGVVLGLSTLQIVKLAPLSKSTSHSWLEYIEEKAGQAKASAVVQYQSYFHIQEEEHHEENRNIVLTSPKSMDVTITQRRVCQIRSQRHIEVCALDGGYLEGISVREGQKVNKGDVMFRILPILYKAKLDAELAEARLAELEYKNTESLFKGQAVVSQNEVLLFKAKFDRAKAKADLARAEMGFTEIKAPFDGIVDRLQQREGSLIDEGDVLTTLSDNSLMWVYFNMPEKDYLEYMAARAQHEAEDRIELLLANHNTLPQPGKIGAIEAQFNNETGNIAFRADFPNPDRLLRHGQTGTILIHRTLHNATVIPQRAVFDLLDKRYVWVLTDGNVLRQRLITISEHELEDIFIIESGLDVKDKIVLEGVRLVQDGEKLEEYEFRKPEDALENQKFHAE